MTGTLLAHIQYRDQWPAIAVRMCETRSWTLDLSLLQLLTPGSTAGGGSSTLLDTANGGDRLPAQTGGFAALLKDQSVKPPALEGEVQSPPAEPADPDAGETSHTLPGLILPHGRTLPLPDWQPAAMDVDPAAAPDAMSPGAAPVTDFTPGHQQPEVVIPPVDAYVMSGVRPEPRPETISSIASADRAHLPPAQALVDPAQTPTSPDAASHSDKTGATSQPHVIGNSAHSGNLQLSMSAVIPEQVGQQISTDRGAQTGTTAGTTVGSAAGTTIGATDFAQGNTPQQTPERAGQTPVDSKRIPGAGVDAQATAAERPPLRNSQLPPTAGEQPQTFKSPTADGLPPSPVITRMMTAASASGQQGAAVANGQISGGAQQPVTADPAQSAPLIRPPAAESGYRMPNPQALQMLSGYLQQPHAGTDAGARGPQAPLPGMAPGVTQPPTQAAPGPMPVPSLINLQTARTQLAAQQNRPTLQSYVEVEQKTQELPLVEKPAAERADVTAIQSRDTVAESSRGTSSPSERAVLGQQVHDQINRALTRQALSSGRLTLQLQPHQLGTIDLTFTEDGGDVQVAILAREGATRDLLEATLPRLRQLMQEAGVNLTDIDLHSEQEQTDSERSAYTTGAQTGTPAEETEEQAFAQPIRRISDNILDAYV